MGPGQTRPSVVAIGASAGGVGALRGVVGCLPVGLPAAVFVVLHVARSGPNPLAEILGRAGPLPVQDAVSGDPVQPGRIIVSQPDQHLIIAGGRILLSREPGLNGHRPSLDALFRSVAREYGGQAVGVVLSGDGDDGAAGLATVARLGGVPIVQDPVGAAHPSMPRQAIRAVPNAQVLPLHRIGPIVADLVAGKPMPDWVRDRPVWTPTAASVGADLEAALSLAVRALDERSRLNTTLAGTRRSVGNIEVAGRYEELATESARASAVIRQWIGTHEDANPPAGKA